MLMDFKDQKNHYLHPDFIEVDINLIKKKPSPLALLAQTCKSIGSKVKDSRHVPICSPHSTFNGLKKVAKRCRSDCSSNGSTVEFHQVFPSKKMKIDNNRTDIVELKNADTSSETSFKTDSSPLIDLLKFFQSSNCSELNNSNKIDLHFSAAPSNVKQNNIVLSKPENKGNRFSVMNGYHLESNDESSTQCDLNNSRKLSPLSEESSRSNDDCVYSSEEYARKSSAIKYCMYCGKLIPVLPMLLAHIQQEHTATTFTNVDSVLNTSMLNTFDKLLKLNPYLASNRTESNQPLSFLTDYLNSSFSGLKNLIC